ncbi:MAG TPA: hypothetical protein VFF27_15085 [Bacteroidia bacterium]|jgi:hypothetical protein|nr:hypothetical protein [Bacteroidia bacterium]
MKLLLTGLVLLLYSLQFKYSNSIVIEHIGEIDKPIATIKITDEKNDTIAEGGRYHHKCSVEEPSYNSIRYIMSTTQGNKTTNKNDFGTFKCTIYEKGAERMHYFLDRKKALVLFDQLIRDLKQKNDNPQLISFLEANKKRINY